MPVSASVTDLLGGVPAGERAAIRRATRLRTRLDRLERGRSPFADSPRERGAHWTKPQLVAEIGFTEWTDDGKLRHPRFIGLRTDKPAKKVVRERPGDEARKSS
ncbi:hypothetical protein [Streptomyces sp. NPDC001816]|uniref:ATP dependent DNA ligase n=1 Tax=Streptomyces sp. NPDC001816 TaxID=3364612 RepID=UPI00367ADB65